MIAYEGILRQTNALHEDFNPNSKYPRSSATWKWRSILSPIWEKYKKETYGEGLIFNRLIRKRSGKGFKMRNGVSKKGHLIYKL